MYFKESGNPVTLKANVSKVLFFDNLNKEKIREILNEYGERICVPITYAEKLIGKNFCTLVFINEVRSVEPFNIDKKGYGLMAAWIAVENINSIRK